MENEAHVKNLHTGLLRSKWAIFSIVGFLVLLTYLLITVSTQVGTSEVQINTAPKADTLDPNYRLPISCDSYQQYVEFSHADIDSIKKELNCPPRPTGGPNTAFAPQAGLTTCEKLDQVRSNIQSMGYFMADMCLRCPMPTPTPGGPLPTPTYPWGPTGTPAPTPTPTSRPYPTTYPTGRYYPTATPTSRPQPTSSGPIIPIDPQPTYPIE